MDPLYKKSSMAFGLIVAVFFVVVIISSRNDGFQDHEYSSSRELIGFSNDHLSTITNRRLLVSPAADYNAYVGDDGSNIGGGNGDDGSNIGGGNGDDGDDGSNIGDGNGDDGSDTNDPVNRGCSKEDIYISQGQTSPLPNGIPTYTVQIQNICMSSCSISDIHLSCGWFSSARLINPYVFRRISYDDCLVNNGNPISPGQTISFQYANTYPYPMSVSSASCY